MARRKREEAGLPTQASAYRNTSTAATRDVKGAPRDLLMANLLKAQEKPANQDASVAMLSELQLSDKKLDLDFAAREVIVVASSE